MKAIRMYEYGGPQVLRFEEVEAPRPGDGGALVHVHAAGVNPIDCKLRAGLRKDKVALTFPWTPGVDFSGVTADGEPVIGKTDPPAQGSYAEQVVVKRSVLAPKPRSLDFVHAAAIPLVGLTAWQALFGVGDARGIEPKPGQTILVLGGAGGVGGMAIQLARWKGARVIASVLPGQEDHVRELGAEPVTDLAAVGEVDGVVDLLGGASAAAAWSHVKHGGAFSSTLGAPSATEATVHGARTMQVWTQTIGDQIRQLAKLVDEGVVRVVVDQTFPLEQAGRAHELLESGHVRGKVVLTVRP